ncbi:amidophosphoribosyltransferase [Candidatus Saccharibacteria bacterium]|nr:MAG: amidophosphoribosyltransferase [Candidatus Saccharibacteria bacterium]PID98997.1 MAG: amidophosphoribosyltransferase [Candidatus Saccharibacteria bacterium]
MLANQAVTKPQEKCAVFGVFGASPAVEAARLSFYGLCALQHRGQESSGIATSDGKKLHLHSDFGLVTTVYRENDLKNLPGHIAIGHNRYSTSGGTEDCFNQPFLDAKHGFAFAHNGNIPDVTKLAAFLKTNHVATRQLNDSGMMSAAIACHLGKGLALPDAIAACYPFFTGVFSAVAMNKDMLVAFRDPRGIRPLSIGKMHDGSHVVASETCALDTIGAVHERDVAPGEMVVITADGIRSQQVVPGEQKLDIFEFVYFARPDSIILGKSVNEVRRNFGRILASECPVQADVVIPVPDSSVPAALGYAEASGIPFEMNLIKNRYIHRTFIRPTQELREHDLKMKLNPLVSAIRGRRVILVDDSIVRGTTMRKTVAMLRDAGATEVHIMISSPPVLYPDYYGINTPTQKELIAPRMTVPEIRSYVAADSLHFLSYDGMVKATGLPEHVFSASCFTGIYPTPIGNRAKEITHINITDRLAPERQ